MYGCMSYYFAIIGTDDQPIYELEAGTYKQGGDGIARFHQEVRELNPYILHASLDIIEDLQWKSNSIFFKNMDHFYGFNISGYLTAGNVKFLMLSDMPNDVETSIRQFFVEVNDLYVKTLLSPFYTVNQVVRSGNFDLKVKLLVKKYL